jgi:hypothetical protein
MNEEQVERVTLPNTKEFKHFWKEKGPYQYALTSMEFPPVLLEPEEWLFSNDVKALLKELMQFDRQKMKIVKSPFNPGNKSILRPSELSEWKINNFPEEWNRCECELFVPEGHLTRVVLDEARKEAENRDKQIDKEQVEDAFFNGLEKRIEGLGYILLKPAGSSKHAVVKDYLDEWEKDEQEAGFL